MNIKTDKIPLSEIKLNPKNPRFIKDEQYKTLLKSLKDFPEMLELREIVVDENMVVLGGNMRYRALKELGEKEAIVKKVSGLTEAQKRQFIIKDNIGIGSWDFELLANDWDISELADWGLEIPDMVDFSQGTEEEQGVLDEKAPTICPECGHTWIKKP